MPTIHCQVEENALTTPRSQLPAQHSLLDMKEDGAAGAEVILTQNDDFLEIRVNDYAGLRELVRSSYGGRLVDVRVGA